MAVKQHDSKILFQMEMQLGEGAFWDSQHNILYWIDILGSRLYAHSPANGTQRNFDMGQFIGTVVTRKSGGLVVALEHGFAFFNPDTNEITPIVDPESDQPLNRFNDGKCDPAGRFWAGTIRKNEGEDGQAALYRLDADHRAHQMLTDVTISNGIVWSSDHKTMYYIDTMTQRVDAFDYDLQTGAIANRRTAITVAPELGYPDGMSIDNNDNLWIAMWGGHQVCQFDPRKGEHQCSIHVPAKNVTSCAFGGPNLEQLYITTARVGITDQELIDQPLAGSVFVAEPQAVGVPSHAFAG